MSRKAFFFFFCTNPIRIILTRIRVNAKAQKFEKKNCKTKKGLKDETEKNEKDTQDLDFHLSAQ